MTTSQDTGAFDATVARSALVAAGLHPPLADELTRYAQDENTRHLSHEQMMPRLLRRSRRFCIVQRAMHPELGRRPRNFLFVCYGGSPIEAEGSAIEIDTASAPTFREALATLRARFSHLPYVQGGL